MISLGDILIWVLTGLLILLTLLPVSKAPHGFVRVADFPRLQILVISVVLILAAPFVLQGAGMAWAMICLGIVATVQAAAVARFTPIWRRQSLDADSRDAGSELSLLVANVKKSNDRHSLTLDIIRDADPDIVLLLEVNAKWIAAVGPPLRKTYREAIERPLENTYGIALYSRLPLFEADIRDLLVADVPSIRSGVELPSGAKVRLYAIHPEPPLPIQDTEGRDGEIAMIGMEAAADTLPAIVAGDLNDVVWSSTLRRFQRLSGLLDPRVGRGFFNTFDARYPFMRWPLDHLFHHPRFRHVEIRRLPKIGSDHFPIFFRLALARDPAALEHPGRADEVETQEVEEIIDREKERNRKPIGADWEKG